MQDPTHMFSDKVQEANLSKLVASDLARATICLPSAAKPATACIQRIKQYGESESPFKNDGMWLPLPPTRAR